jgi:sec-independent protein translocase protein TatC
MIAAVVLFSIIAFFFKDIIFEVILGPKGNDFITYRVLEEISSMLFKDSVSIEDMDVKLINTGLAQQFMIHIKASVCAGILVTSPYLLYLLFHFISPALYSHERKCAIQIVSSGYIMFIAGVLLSYFLIFPLTFRFLPIQQFLPTVNVPVHSIGPTTFVPSPMEKPIVFSNFRLIRKVLGFAPWNTLLTKKMTITRHILLR